MIVKKIPEVIIIDSECKKLKKEGVAEGFCANDFCIGQVIYCTSWLEGQTKARIETKEKKGMFFFYTFKKED